MTGYVYHINILYTCCFHSGSLDSGWEGNGQHVGFVKDGGIDRHVAISSIPTPMLHVN